MFKCFTKNFVKAYYLRKITRVVVYLLYYINLLIPKDKKLILAFVDYEKISGRLIPYKNDNVYMIAQYIENKCNLCKVIYIPSNQFGGRNSTSISLRKKIFFFLKINFIDNYTC
jgi:hypothetical protein